MSISPLPPPSGVLTQAVAGLGQAVDTLADTPPWRAGDPELLQALVELNRVEARVAAVRLALVHQVDARQVAVTAGAPSTAAWLGGVLRQRPSTARAQVRLAAALNAAHQHTGTALADGTISADHAHVVVTALAGLPATVPAADLRAAEHTLVRESTIRDPRQVAFLARHLRYVTDPDGATALAREEHRLTSRRELTLTVIEDGWVDLRGTLAAEAGALLITALDPLAAPRPATATAPTRAPPPAAAPTP